MDRRAVALFLVLTTGVVAAAPKFVAVWKAADVSRLNFLGKKVAALVIHPEEFLR